MHEGDKTGVWGLVSGDFEVATNQNRDRPTACMFQL